MVSLTTSIKHFASRNRWTVVTKRNAHPFSRLNRELFRELVSQPGMHPFVASRNNDPDNGLALSKNAHWLFDNGLWSIENDYTVITADRHFAESGDAALLLTAMKGRQIRLPIKQNVWPARKHLEWHRNHTFLGD
jgi:putative restriction endonuclease